MGLMPRRFGFGVVAGVLLLAIGGFALADEAEEPDENGDLGAQQTDEGPPWLRFDVDGWLPGDGAPPWVGGPPPWADGSDDESGDGPPWLDPDLDIDWRPGDGAPPWVGGPTPWSNAAEHAGHGPRWFEGDAEWTPGDGKPPWAGGPGNGNSNGNG
jgi:hypothetical protein